MLSLHATFLKLFITRGLSARASLRPRSLFFSTTRCSKALPQKIPSKKPDETGEKKDEKDAEKQENNLFGEYYRLRGMVLAIDRYCELAEVTKERPVPSVERFAHYKLEEAELNVLHATGYDKTISILMAHRRFVEAETVHGRMLKKGLFPSPTTTVHMALVGLFLDPNFKTRVASGNFLPSLDEVFARKDYSEHRFRELFDFFVKSNYPPRLVNFIAQRYIVARGPKYQLSPSLISKIVAMKAKEGKLEEALDWASQLHEHKAMSAAQVINENALPRADPAVLRPYVSVLTNIKRTASWNTEATTKVLEHMQQACLRPDIVVMNTLLALEVSRHNLRTTFALYEVIVQLSKSEPRIIPDRFTYGSLFQVLVRLYNPTARTVFTRMYKKPNNIIPPRELFRDMLSYAGSLLSIEPVVNTYVLNLAIRTFLYRHDYPAAFVAARAFFALNVRPNVETYRTILKHLSERILREVTIPHEPGITTWGDRMLMKRSGASIQSTQMPERFITYLLGVCQVPKIEGKFRPRFTRAKREYKIPTLGMITRKEPVPLPDEYDSTPLERVLRRAIAANRLPYGMSQTLANYSDEKIEEILDGSHDDLEDDLKDDLEDQSIPLAKWVSRRIKEAKADTIPVYDDLPEFLRPPETNCRKDLRKFQYNDDFLPKMPEHNKRTGISDSPEPRF